MPWIIVLFSIIFLIFLNALYVAAEFSAVSTRRSRLSQFGTEGNRSASRLLTILEDPNKLDTYVATCQLGITVSSLLLGFYGQSQLTPVISPYLVRFGRLSNIAAQSISATVILLFLTFLQVLLGELVPKNIGIQYPEQLALRTMIPMQWSMVLFRPLIWFFNGSGQLVMRLFGREVIAEHTHVHAPEEIVMLVEESGAGGLIQQEERRLLKNTLEMRESMVRQVMIPRTRITAAPDHLSPNEILTMLAESPFSRIPLYRGTIDNIVGVVHLKDLLYLGQQIDVRRNLAEIMRPIPFVPETMLVKTVFSLLQRKHLQVAIVLDEFGGTAGMVTLEDLIEEIFGELQDEFDTYVPALRTMPGNRLWIRGDTLIEDINKQLEDLNLPNENIDTIGGLVLSAIGHVPSIGEEVEIDTGKFRVEKMSGRGITAVSMEVPPETIANLQKERK